RANLAKVFSGDAVRSVFRENALVRIATLDSFDAARLLLVPEHLEDGEAIAAVIPDRDTLALLPVPQDNDWSKIAELAKMPLKPDHLLLNRPVKVTRAGFEVK